MKKVSEIRSRLASVKWKLRTILKNKPSDGLFPAMPSSIEEIQLQVVINTLEWILEHKQ